MDLLIGSDRKPWGSEGGSGIRLVIMFTGTGWTKIKIANGPGWPTRAARAVAEMLEADRG